MSKDINAKSMYVIIKKLLGEIEPTGRTYIDIIRSENIEEYIELINTLLFDFYNIAKKKDAYESSVREIGVKAHQAFKGFGETVNDVLEGDE